MEELYDHELLKNENIPVSNKQYMNNILKSVIENSMDYDGLMEYLNTPDPFLIKVPKFVEAGIETPQAFLDTLMTNEEYGGLYENFMTRLKVPLIVKQHQGPTAQHKFHPTKSNTEIKTIFDEYIDGTAELINIKDSLSTVMSDGRTEYQFYVDEYNSKQSQLKEYDAKILALEESWKVSKRDFNERTHFKSGGEELNNYNPFKWDIALPNILRPDVWKAGASNLLEGFTQDLASIITAPAQVKDIVTDDYGEYGFGQSVRQDDFVFDPLTGKYGDVHSDKIESQIVKLYKERDALEKTFMSSDIYTTTKNIDALQKRNNRNKKIIEESGIDELLETVGTQQTLEMLTSESAYKHVK